MIKLKKGMTPSFSPDGSVLATSSSSSVLIHNVADGSLRTKFKALPHISHLAFAPTGDRVAVKSTSGRIAVFDLEGKLIVDCKNQKEGEGVSPVWTRDGTQLIDGSWKGRMYRRDAATGEVLRDAPAEMVHDVQLLPNGRHATMQTTTGDAPFNHMEFFDPVTLAPTSEKLMFGGYRSSSGVSPHGQYAWAVRVEPTGLHFDLLDLSLGVIAERLIATGGSGHANAFAPGNIEMTAVVREKTITRMSLPDLREIASYDIEYPSCAAYSPLGDRLALGGWTSGLLVTL